MVGTTTAMSMLMLTRRARWGFDDYCVPTKVPRYLPNELV